MQQNLAEETAVLSSGCQPVMEMPAPIPTMINLKQQNLNYKTAKEGEKPSVRYGDLQEESGMPTSSRQTAQAEGTKVGIPSLPQALYTPDLSPNTLMIASKRVLPVLQCDSRVSTFLFMYWFCDCYSAPWLCSIAALLLTMYPLGAVPVSSEWLPKLSLFKHKLLWYQIYNKKRAEMVF